jgi:hypothetical protein
MEVLVLLLASQEQLPFMVEVEVVEPELLAAEVEA